MDFLKKVALRIDYIYIIQVLVLSIEVPAMTVGTWIHTIVGPNLIS